MGTWIAVGNLRLLVLVFSFGAVFAFVLLTLRNWQAGIIIFFIWIALEDLVRKYIGNQMILYAAKDVVILTAYVSYFIPRPLRQRECEMFRNPLKIVLLLWFGWALVEIFNPHVGHPLEPLVGLRMSFFYIPMIYLGYNFINSEEKLRQFLKLNILIGTIVAILGIIQAIVGLHFLNPSGFVSYLRLDLIRTAPEAGLAVPRPNSVFVEAGRFAQYLYIILLLSLGTLAYWPHLKTSKMRPIYSISWVWISIIVISIGLFISGQRAAMYLIALLLPILLLSRNYERRGRLHGTKSSMPFFRLGLILFVGFLILWSLFPQRFQATYEFYSKTLAPTERHFEVPYRIDSLLWQIKYALRQSPLIGHGTGTNSLGRQYIYGIADLYTGGAPYLGGVEVGYGAIIWEWGVIGLVLWLWWTVKLIKHSVKITLSLSGTRFFWLAVILSFYLFSILFLWFFLGVQVYQNYITAAYLWFLAGVLFKLPQLTGRPANYEG